MRGMDGLELKSRLRELGIRLPVIVMTGQEDAETARTSSEQSASEAAARIATLSPRERQVLEGIVLGHASKVIAYDLGISLRTVEVHRARMLERLGTRSVAAAIRLAVMAGLASGQL